MSQESVDVVRRVYEGFGRDLAAPIGEADLVELVDPDVHLDLTRRTFNPASYDGYAGMLRGREDIRQIWDQWLVQPERFIPAGDRVIVVETVTGRGRGSGVEIVDRSWSSFSLRDGRIVRIVVYFDGDEALEAAGLDEL